MSPELKAMMEPRDHVEDCFGYRSKGKEGFKRSRHPEDADRAKFNDKRSARQGGRRRISQEIAFDE